MSNQHEPLAGSASAQHQSLNGQAAIFLFDLKNEATEHGFGESGSWTLELATEGELRSLRRLHHPVIALRLKPHDLLNIFKQVKSKLQQPLTRQEMELNANDMTMNNKNQLVAYPAQKAR